VYVINYKHNKDVEATDSEGYIELPFWLNLFSVLRITIKEIIIFLSKYNMSNGRNFNFQVWILFLADMRPLGK
jgi:hypothetical protein